MKLVFKWRYLIIEILQPRLIIILLWVKRNNTYNDKIKGKIWGSVNKDSDYNRAVIVAGNCIFKISRIKSKRTGHLRKFHLVITGKRIIICGIILKFWLGLHDVEVMFYFVVVLSWFTNIKLIENIPPNRDSYNKMRAITFCYIW